jgi:hypothetical protein
MADRTVFQTITGALDVIAAPVIAAAEALDPTGAIKAIEQQVFGSRYQFKSAFFPEDLGAEYMGHWMTVKLFDSAYGTGTGAVGAGPGTAVFGAALFMPSATGGGSTPIYTDTHEYADVKLTNIVTDKFLGIAGVNALGVARRAINPGVQVLYRSTALRTFQFGFLFAPRSEKESQNMEEIILNIRKFAAPVNQGITLITPAEVEIKFWFNGQENPHIPKLKRCVIEAIETNYSPQGEWSTFTNGYPVSCLFTFKVREMEIIFRDDITPGGY